MKTCAMFERCTSFAHALDLAKKPMDKKKNLCQKIEYFLCESSIKCDQYMCSFIQAAAG